MSAFFLPNALTIGRLAVIPVVLYLLLEMPAHPGYRMAALLVLVAQQVSDILDGFLARRIKRRHGGDNRFGAVMDPLADKLFIGSTYIVFSAAFGFPWWITLTILGKDIWLLSGWWLRARIYGIRTVKPNFFGKTADSLQALVIFGWLLAVPAGMLRAGIAVMVGFTVLAGLLYTVAGAREIRRRNRPGRRSVA